MEKKRGRPPGQEPQSGAKKSGGPLGDLIRRKRLERGLGLRDVAKAVKCSVQFISNIEHGRAPLPWEKTERLSSYLEISMEDLQAANLIIRADYKKMAFSGKKRIPKSGTALASVRDVVSAMSPSPGSDPQLSEFLRSVQSLPAANRKKFIAEARKLLETL
jgi:transcriptional regulator with XRE-family HTH domain